MSKHDATATTSLITIDFSVLHKIRSWIKHNNVTAIRELSVQYNCSDFADLLSHLTSAVQIIYVLNVINTTLSAEIFSFFSPATKERIVISLTSADIKKLIALLKRDDLYDLLDELPSNLVKKLITAFPPKSNQRELINTLLSYEEDMAGCLINDDFIELVESDTVDVAIDKIRHNYNNYSHISTYYVINKQRTLVGFISIQKLIFSHKDKTLAKIMDKNIIYAKARDDQEHVANLFKKYDVNELPAVNSEKKLLGIITIDDVIDVIEEEATEDIQKLAAIEPLEFSYLRSGIWTLTRSRIRWLAFLMISATLSQIAIAGFISSIDSSQLISVVALTYLVSLLPIISGTSGNAGSQSSTIIVRSLSTGEITTKDYGKLLWKELRVSALTGFLLALINALRMIIINVITNYSGGGPHVFMTSWQIRILISTAFALFIVIVLAKVVGVTLPVIAKIIKIDPAVMAAPLLTTLLDALSTTIFFSAAMIVFLI